MGLRKKERKEETGFDCGVPGIAARLVGFSEIDCGGGFCAWYTRCSATPSEVVGNTSDGDRF